MKNSVTVAEYILALDKDGPDGGFELVHNAYENQIERYIGYKLSCSCYRFWGRCIDPEGHKKDVTQDTFFKFSDFNNKFVTSGYKKELKTILGLLKHISKTKIYEHLNCRRCSDLPTDSTICLDEADYWLPGNGTGRDIEDYLIFIQAKESLSREYQEALEDFIYGLSHEEISIERSFTKEVSRQLRFKAIHMFRQFQEK